MERKLILTSISMLLLLTCAVTHAQEQTTTTNEQATTTTSMACNYQNCTTNDGYPGYCYWGACYPIVACCTQNGCMQINSHDCMNYYGGNYKSAGTGCDPNPCVTTTTSTTTTNPTMTTLAECPSYYWFDEQSNKTCGYKKFCGDYQYSGLSIYNSSEECLQSLLAANTQRASNCTSLWWFHEEHNATCAVKQFCGNYAYQGLKVYASPQACYGNKTNKPVHNLDTGRNYYSIRAAIYDNSTLDGHTITADPGTYWENVEVIKSLNIRSTSGTPNDTIIRGHNWDRHIFNVIAGNVNISGFSFKAKRSYLHAFFPIPPGGIYLQRADGCNISNNVFDELSVGISLEGSSYNTIKNNAFRNTGMQVWYPSHYNTVTGNTVNRKPLVYLEGVTGETVTDAGQVILVRCSAITVSGLTIGNTSNAIRMLETNDSTITGNMLRDDNHDGLHISRSNGNMISGNGFKGNVRNGIHMYLSTGNTVSGNLLRNNRGNGIHVERSSENTIRDNDILYSYQGIVLWERSENNTLTNNTVALTSKGVTFAPYSNGNTMTENTICRNTIWDIMSAGNNTGSDNACRIAINWYDGNIRGCAQRCSGAPATTTTTTQAATTSQGTQTTTTTEATTTTMPGNTRLWIERTIPHGASNGTTQEIKLTMTVNQSDTPLVVGLTEYYPDSWSVSDISSSGIAKDGRIEWLFSSLTTPVNDTAITYSVQIPAAANGEYTFSGTAQTEDNTIETTGDDAINVGEGTECTLAGDTPPCGEVTLGEVVAMITDWAAGDATLGDTVNLIGVWASSV